MEQRPHYRKSEAKAVLSKHQHKVTRHRVDVLLYLMEHRRAFTFKQLTAVFESHIDRATVYRILLAFVDLKIVSKALNEKGYTCFFYKAHLKDAENLHSFLECIHCDEIFGLPAYPNQYLNALNKFQTTPLTTLLKGHCNRQECVGNV